MAIEGFGQHHHRHVMRLWPYLLVGLGLWTAMLFSGIHVYGHWVGENGRRLIKSDSAMGAAFQSCHCGAALTAVAVITASCV